jgi:hypothetical protein
MSRDYWEEKYRDLEEKSKKLTKLLDDISKEFSDLQNLIDVGEGYFLPNARINMDGSDEENERLINGWYPSDQGFRWGGRYGENPCLYFVVNTERSYKLALRVFVPKQISKSPVKVFANDMEIHSFISEGKTEKTIYIPGDLIKSSRLKIHFESDFWNPAKIDKRASNKKVSLAFNYIELIEI